MSSVRLDRQGRVVAVSSGPPRKGWVEAPRSRDLWCLQRAADGEWLEMSARGCAIRDDDHASKGAPGGPHLQRLRKLRGRSAHNLSQGEIAQAILDFAAAL